MKNFSIALYLLLLVSMGIGCSDLYTDANWKPSLEKHYLSTDQSKIISTGQAFERTFTVTSINTSWTFTSVPAWISLTPTSGTSNRTVTLSAEANPSAESSRTGIFYLSSVPSLQTQSRAITVTQSEATPSLSAQTETIELPGKATTYTLDVTANCTWKASANATWLSVSILSSQLQITAAENQTYNYRTGTITLKYGYNKSVTVQVKQAPSQITVSSATLHCDNDAAQFSVKLTSDVSWTAIASDSWINVSPISGSAGTSTITIDVAPNETVNTRKGAITIRTGTTNRQQISIEQEGIYIQTVESDITLLSGVNSKLLHIACNSNWVVESLPVWISLSALSGSGDDCLTITTVDNPNTAARQGLIVLSVPGLSASCSVTLVQSGKSFDTNGNLLEFSDKAESQQFDVKTDASWTSSFSSTWFSVTPLSGVGDATITVAVDENKATDERTGSILYLYSDAYTSVTVHQLAKYLSVENQSFDFSSKGGTHQIALMTNERWTATVEHDVDWLSISETSGEGSSQIILEVKDNPSVNRRSTSLIITPEYAQGVQILISQEPRQLKVNTESILLFSQGGTSEPIIVETDGTFEVTTETSWIAIARGSDNVFTVVAAQNPTEAPRRGEVSIRLTDLQEGSLELSLPVIQSGEGGSFVLNGYEQEVDWDITPNGNCTIVIAGFTTDDSWNRTSDGNCSIAFTKFTTDGNWNIYPQSSLSIKVTGYTNDLDWNLRNPATGHIVIQPYGVDTKWESCVSSQQENNVEISKYPIDKEWAGE